MRDPDSVGTHNSSLSKAKLVRADPLRVGKRRILRTHRNPFVQLGNTGLWPFDLRSFGRQFQDAPSDGRRSSFAFPGWKWFHMLSCHSTPGRRGRIRSITDRPWLFGLLNAVSASLPYGWAATNRVARSNSLSMFCIRYRMDLGPLCYTGSLLSSRRVTLDNPVSTACHFGPSLKQPRMARFL